MSSRAMLAILLAALLLWVPCAASACAMSCGMARMSSSCHQTATMTADQCGRTATAVPGCAVLHAAACTHTICVAHPQSLEAVPASTPGDSQPQLAVSFAALDAAALQPTFRPSRAEAPPLRLPLLAYLQTPLRV